MSLEGAQEKSKNNGEAREKGKIRGCAYREFYWDHEAEEYLEWECDMPALPGRKYCLFHDPNYWREHPNEVRQAFYERVKRIIERKEDGYFIGYHLPDIELWGVEFKKKVYFNYAHFHGQAFFVDAHFHGEARFDSARFEKWRTLFDGARFHDKVSFKDAHFKRGASFTGAHFHSKADFTATHFHGRANFSNVHFHGEACFNTYFHGEAIFLKAHFHGKASFEGAHFYDKARFNGAHFYGKVFFTACFYNEASFWLVHFKQKTEFMVTFYGEVNFYEAQFHGEVKFYDTHFKQGAIFDRAYFRGKVEFYDTHFRGLTTFRDVLLANPLVFSDCWFQGAHEDPFDLKLRLIFRDVIFKGEGKMVFRNVDMSRVSLMFVDLSHVEFRDVRWWNYGDAFMTVDAVVLLAKANKNFAGKYIKEVRRELKRLLISLNKGVVPGVLMYQKEDMYEIVKEELKQRGSESISEDEFEEQVWRETMARLKNVVKSWGDKKLLIPDDPDLTLENVLQELRNLKEWHIACGRYEEAAKFHIAEMDVRRLVGQERERHLIWPPRGLWGELKERVSSWVEKRLLWLYRVLCLYGESVARPFLWLILIWLTFGLIYAFSGLAAMPFSHPSLAPGSHLLAIFLRLLIEGLVFSASVITLMLLVRAPPVIATWGYLAWAEAAFVLFIYAVLAPTLTRRIWRLVRA